MGDGDRDARWRRQQALAERRRRGETPWARFAADLGLEPAESGTVAILRGKVDGASVKVTRTWAPLERGRAEREAQWQVSIRHPTIASGLKLRAEGRLSGIRRALGREDVLTGDKPFDDEVKISGDEALAVGVLGESTRALMTELLPLGVRVEQQTITVAVTDAAGLEVWARRIRQLLTFAVRLAQTPDDAVGLLLRNARSDRLATVRLANLRLALRRAPSAVAELAPELLRDADPTVRALAALCSGDLGVAELEAFVQRPDAGHELLDKALARLADTPLTERSEGALCRMLTRDVGDRSAIIAALAEVGTHDAVPALLHVGKRLLSRRSVRTAVNAALSVIQDRHGPVPGGRLSLATTTGVHGALSALRGRGRLSRAASSKADTDT